MLYYLIRCTLSYLSFTGKEDKGNTAKYCCPHCMKIKDQEVKLFLIGVIFSNKNKSKLQNTFKDMKDLFWAFFGFVLCFIFIFIFTFWKMWEPWRKSVRYFYFQPIFSSTTVFLKITTRSLLHKSGFKAAFKGLQVLW